MASIAIKNGKYTVRWRKLDGDEQRRACPTARAAKELKRQVEESLALGRDWEPVVIRLEPDLQEIAKAYLSERALLRAAPKTVRVAGMHLDLFMRFLRSKQPKGELDSSLLSRTLIMEFVTWLADPETGRHKRARGEEMIRKTTRNVELFWIWAEQSERWPDQIPRPRRVAFPPKPQKRVLAPTWEEMDAVVLTCTANLRRLAIWLRYTGLRVGESMGFTWSDVDMEQGLLDIRPELDKNGVGRTIPLCPHLLDEIATWGKRDGFIIPSRRKPGVREREGRARDMGRAWKRAGVREAVWKQRPDHAFRKGFKSGMLGIGANRDAVDYLQGHSLGGGSRGRYIDGAHLPLRETVASIPKIGGDTGNLTRLPVRK